MNPVLLQQRLLALFTGGWALFSFPLLKLWLAGRTWLGLPLLPLALFASWALLIALLAWWLEGRGGQAEPGGGG